MGHRAELGGGWRLHCGHTIMRLSGSRLFHPCRCSLVSLSDYLGVSCHFQQGQQTTNPLYFGFLHIELIGSLDCKVDMVIPDGRILPRCRHHNMSKKDFSYPGPVSNPS